MAPAQSSCRYRYQCPSITVATPSIATCFAPFSLAHGSASPLPLRAPGASHLHRHAHHPLLPTPAYRRLTTDSLVVVAGIMRIHTLHSHLPQLRVQLKVLCSISQHLSRALRWLWHVLGISLVFSYSYCTTSHLERWTHVRMLIPPEPQPFSALRSARSQLGGDGKEESTPFETPNLLPAPSVVTVVTGRHAEPYLWHATSFAHATC